MFTSCEGRATAKLSKLRARLQLSVSELLSRIIEGRDMWRKRE